MVNHYYFYCRRPRLRAVLPEVLQLLSLQRQAVPERPRVRQTTAGARRASPSRRSTTASCRCADPKRLQAICDGLSAAQDRRAAAQVAAPSAASLHRRGPQAGYRYDLSILQAEFSLTQVLDRPVHGRIFFEQVIRENLDLGRPDQVQLIFDRGSSAAHPGRFRTRVLTEGSSHLCTSTTSARASSSITRKAARCGPRPRSTTPRLRDRQAPAQPAALRADRLCRQPAPARASNVSATIACSPKTTFQAIERPVGRDRQRASGLRFADPKVHNLWHALLLFRLLADGFRSADLRQHIADLEGRAAQTIGRGAITYQLRRLRLHGMIERLPNSHRYRVTDLGWRTAVFFTRTYNRLLRPGLAAVLPGHAAEIVPLTRAFDALDRRVQQCLAQHCLAA